MKDFTIDGYVTKNVETRATQSGQLVTRFSVNSPNYNRETKSSVPQFFECEYWHSGPQDQKAANIVEGALLLLWGGLAFDQWQDQQTGQNRSKVKLKVREVGVIRPPQPRAQAYQGAPQQPAHAPQGYQQPVPQAYQQAPAQGYRQAAPAAPAAQRGPAPAPAPQQPAYAPQAYQQPAAAGDTCGDMYDEDIPF